MKICVAQTRPIKGEILANIANHKILITLAIRNKADAIFFPELSLTSYESELAKDLATTIDDIRFDDFQTISNKNKITIGLGLPIKTNTGIQITMLIFQPDTLRIGYAKQQLHTDELLYFEKGEGQLIISIVGKKIAPAICYESLQPDHADAACKLGADLYITSVAKSQKGLDAAMIHYPEMAKKYLMPVLMANSVGYCDNFMSVGRSAVWNNRGTLIAQLNDQTEGLIVFDTETEEVTKKML